MPEPDQGDGAPASGFDLRQLIPTGRCRHAIGIDLSAGMLNQLGDITPRERLSRLQADAQQLPLGDDSVDVALAMHMLYHVPDIGAAVRELRRITRLAGTVLASTNSAGTLSEMNGLFDAVVADILGRDVPALPGLSFTTENGADILGQEFSDVSLRSYEAALSFPDPGPVVGYIDSLREPTLSYAGEQFPFDEALQELAARIDQIIRTEGRFRTISRGGVFICRLPRAV
jgi:SAM-dependent methyltransferase